MLPTIHTKQILHMGDTESLNVWTVAPIQKSHTSHHIILKYGMPYSQCMNKTRWGIPNDNDSRPFPMQLHQEAKSTTLMALTFEPTIPF